MEKIKICKKCSRIDKKELKKYLEEHGMEYKIKVKECIGECKLRKTEKCFGKVDGKVLVFESQALFFRALLAKEK
ncbi:MAG: hypothetical protein SPL05_00395 [Eubacteriales bacterium]|nr:hypothetical protein [Eubacteriales bacterium]